jgi:hypothetical protein
MHSLNVLNGVEASGLALLDVAYVDAVGLGARKGHSIKLIRFFGEQGGSACKNCHLEAVDGLEIEHVHVVGFLFHMLGDLLFPGA